MAINYNPFDQFANKSAFVSDGSMAITTSGGFSANVTPTGGVPLVGIAGAASLCAGAVNQVGGQIVEYALTGADIANGSVTFLATYASGTAWISGGLSNFVSAATPVGVKIAPIPTCTIAPASQQLCAGSSATFTVSGTGSSPLTFNWTGPNGFTATGATITINNAQSANAGTYTATVTDAFACTSTCTAQLTVVPCGCVCVNPGLGLGAAATTTVLELDGASVSITGPPGGILGNIDIGSGGELSLTGSEFVTGTIKLAPGATFSDSSSGSVGGVQHNVDLSAEINAAYAAATADASLPCTQNFTTLDGKTVTKIIGTNGINVICVKDVVLSGKQILVTGPSDALFIFNVTGKFVLTGGGAGPQIRVDQSAGLQPSAVLYNVIGTGPDVAFSGGGGGANCCEAIVDGSILAPFRKINLSPGLVNGEIISGLDISIVSGSSVRCPCPPQ